MANKFVYCVCFALAISHLTLPSDVCQPEAFWFMKRVLLFQSYQEKLKIPYATFHECSRPVPWAWAGEMGWGWRSTSCMMGNVINNGESVFTLNKGEFALFISLS